MSVGFIRRFLFDPGNAELTAIEGVVVIDREPPASITGVGSGAVLVVGEFENGPFAAASGVAEMPQSVLPNIKLISRCWFATARFRFIRTLP
jgi:hypothetical protein